jgi:ketosteroid isomerase-like protein
VTAPGAEDNKAIIQRVLAGYAEGRLEPLFAALDPAIRFRTNARPEHFRFGGERLGTNGILIALSMVAAQYDVLRYNVREIVSEGDLAWSWSDVAFRHRPSGRKVEMEMVSRWKFSDGKIVEYSEYFDTAAVMKQEGRLDLEESPAPAEARAG